MNNTLTSRVVVLAGLLSVLFPLNDPARAAGRNPALSTPELLVDLARDSGLRSRGKQTPADVLRIKTLLRGALRLDARQTRASTWLYELAARGDQSAEAAEVLARLVAIDPTNTTAFANWLEIGPPEVQSAEQRRAWLAGLLGAEQRPDRLALVHTHLARLALQQVDHELARHHLDEALQHWPECPDAPVLGLELVTPNAPPAERLSAVLQALRVNPVQVGLAWEAGLLLDECGFAAEAFGFYEHAVSVHSTVGTGLALPPEKVLQLSRNALARSKLNEALGYVQEAAKGERGTHAAKFSLYWILEGHAPANMIESLKAAMTRDYAEIRDPAESSVGLVSEAAWYHCVIDEQPQRALMLAEHAARRAPGDVFATRVLGWAQALNQRNEEAQRTLTPIAAVDPYAAYRLATLLLDAGDTEAPERLVRGLTYIPTAGWARTLLDRLDVGEDALRTGPSRYPEVARVLASFDRRVLEFHKEPARYLVAELKLENPSPMPGEPWWAVFSLTNRASFPITLGPDWMVNPVFLLSFRVEGDRQREFPNLMTIGLDHARVIRPGGTIRVRRTIDVGPLRTLSRQTPQHLQSVYVTPILDPEQTPGGRWRASGTGQMLRPVPFVRTPANTNPEAWHARFGALRGDSARARFQVLEVSAQLLGETQRARRHQASGKPLTYRPQAIPVDLVNQALLGALGSDSWEVRVRALDALQAAGLNQALVDAARQCLDHPHWAVRMMAVRLLARLGAANFAETAKRIAAQDADELVRDMARSYAEQWSGPAKSEKPGQ